MSPEVTDTEKAWLIEEKLRAEEAKLAESRKRNPSPDVIGADRAAGAAAAAEVAVATTEVALEATIGGTEQLLKADPPSSSSNSPGILLSRPAPEKKGHAHSNPVDNLLRIGDAQGDSVKRDKCEQGSKTHNQRTEENGAE